MREHNLHKCKDKIVLFSLKYADAKRAVYKNQALEEISILAKFYKITLRRRNVSAYDLKQTVYDFLENKKGYNDTLVVLFNILNY